MYVICLLVHHNEMFHPTSTTTSVLFSTERSRGTSNIWMQMVRRFWALQEIRTVCYHAVSKSCTTVSRTLLCHISWRIC